MNYTKNFKWLQAVWNVESPAVEVVEEVVEPVIEDPHTYATLTIHLKGGRSLSLRAWVDKGTNIDDHTLWKGMTDWLNDGADNTPYFFTSGGDSYHTCIVKSEVAQIELVKEKDKE